MDYLLDITVDGSLTACVGLMYHLSIHLPVVYQIGGALLEDEM